MLKPVVGCSLCTDGPLPQEKSSPDSSWGSGDVCTQARLVEIVSCLFSNDLGWIDYYFISLWYERNVFLFHKVHPTNLERFIWTNWLFCGTNYFMERSDYWLERSDHGTKWQVTVMHLADRLPMNKLKSLLQKTQKVTLFVWKSIRKIHHCRLKSLFR